MSDCGIKKTSLFGDKTNFIKYYGGNLIAVEGPNTKEKLLLEQLRIPYKQIVKGNVYLKPGQVNYFLNHLGLGDSCTFLCIAAKYDQKSKFEEDNYVEYSYYNDLTKIYYFSHVLTLSGNSLKRIPQLYLTNPNANYPVYLEVLIAVIDDTYSIFTDTLNQSGTSFVGLEYTDIKSYVVGESIVFYDKSSPKRPLIYIELGNIDAITKSGNIIIIDDGTLGTLFFQFKTEYDANQANSLLNYVLSNADINIDLLSPLADDISPIIGFNSIAGATGNYISFNGATAGVPYDTTDGFTFSTSISLSTYGTFSGTQSIFNKERLIELIVASASDNRDGPITLQPSNLVITASSGTVSTITQVGTYSVTFDLKDIAQNDLNGYVLNLNITS